MIGISSVPVRGLYLLSGLVFTHFLRSSGPSDAALYYLSLSV